MAKYLSKDIESLARELIATPVRRHWVEQVWRIAELVRAIEPARAYSIEWTRFRITQKRRKTEMEVDAQIPGDTLLNDLVLLVEAVSRKAGLKTSELPEAALTHEQLAEELSISTKTVRRWRGRGLLGVRVACEDGVSRLLFPRSAVDHFVRANGDLVRKGAAFRQLSEAERQTIIDRARAILAARPIRLHAVARRISEETGRAVETIRYTLRRFEMSGEGEPLYARSQSGIGAREEMLWARHEAGVDAATIACETDLPLEDVESVLRRVQVLRWKQEPPSFVYSDLFDVPGAEEMFLRAPEPERGEPVQEVSIPRDVPAYLRALYTIPLLTAAQELDLFRRYNYAKFLAARIIRRLKPETAAACDVRDARALLALADGYRRRIIAANLRLVVSIAKKHVGWGKNFFEVVSDGNVSLMRAVEKFDFSRGNKFSTYASWAIMKNFARTIPEQRYHYHRFVTGLEEVLHAEPDATPAVVDHEDDRQRVREQIATALGRLEPREREILSCHYGLFGGEQPLTLEQIGRRFGVTKERIRQIERRALARLRDELGSDLADAVA